MGSEHDDTLEFLTRMNERDATVAGRVRAALGEIARAVELCAARYGAGGRIVPVGAGTSGRLGALDAAEWTPTFGIPAARVPALLAGGRDALFTAVEGAEDDAEAARRDLDKIHLTQGDSVVGLSASGSTPYVVGALTEARRRGALTVGVFCTPGGAAQPLCDVPIVVDTGPEIVAGSTRLMAGTAQKLVLNMLSTAIARRLGLIVRGEMVAMRPTNAKLRARAVRIARDLLDVEETRARALLEACEWDLPAALVAGRHHLTAADARRRIEAAGGNVAKAFDA